MEFQLIHLHSNGAGVWHGSLDDVKEERPRLESSNTRDPCSTHRSCAASDSKPARSFSKTCKSSSGATRTIKKTSNPACGPCDNCGTSVSPQWRHGSKQKPTVCNACGIRYLRTGCFDRVPVSYHMVGLCVLLWLMWSLLQTTRPLRFHLHDT